MTSTSDQMVNKEKYDSNFDRIFGGRKKGGSFIQDPITGKLIDRENLVARPRVNAPTVLKPLPEFISPIDQTVISNRGQLAAHNKRHGVTDMRDYGNGYIKKAEKKRIADGLKYLKKTRIEDIKRAIEIHS